MPAISMSNLGPVPGQYVPPTPLAATPQPPMPWDMPMPPPQANTTLTGDMTYDMPIEPHPINMPGAGLLEGENSDDYWNALIDGTSALNALI